MNNKLSRRIFLSQMLLAASACATEKIVVNQRLVIGIISYGKGKQTKERLTGFQEYLSEKMKTIIEISSNISISYHNGVRNYVYVFTGFSKSILGE